MKEGMALIKRKKDEIFNNFTLFSILFLVFVLSSCLTLSEGSSLGDGFHSNLTKPDAIHFSSTRNNISSKSLSQPHSNIEALENTNNTENVSDSSIINMESLLEDMIDLERLTHRPRSGSRTAQASSYDRASKIENGKRIDWFANDDCGNFIRVINREGRKEKVLADLEGPGAIVRIWSANPQGTLRIYLDNSSESVIEEDFEKLLSGEMSYPFTEPFAGMCAWGANLYFPIPFENSALVTCQNPKDLYYHIGYRLFPEGTEINSYNQTLVEKVETKANQVAKRLSQPYSTWKKPENSETTHLSWRIPPRKSQKITLRGPASIVALDFDMSASNLENMLRSTVLKITWDNYENPSLWSPLGDFFGTSPGINPYRGLPLGMLDNGRMYSRWVMSFENKAKIEVVNEGLENIDLNGRIVTQPIDWNDSLMYFHAKWKTDYPIPTRPQRDWKVLKTEGPGRFVGFALSVANPSWFWWGEGDEKFYVDNEDFPSTFGTGTEDYFGYAWGNPALFSHAYHNQPRADGPLFYGHVSNNRFHVFDSVPFENEFRFDIEVWHTRETEVGFSGISYWYTKAVNQDSYVTPVSVEDRKIVRFPPLLSIPWNLVKWIIKIIIGVAIFGFYWHTYIKR